MRGRQWGPGGSHTEALPSPSSRHASECGLMLSVSSSVSGSSKCGPRTRSIGIPWESLGNAESWDPAWTQSQNQIPRRFVCALKSERICLRTPQLGLTNPPLTSNFPPPSKKPREPSSLPTHSSFQWIQLPLTPGLSMGRRKGIFSASRSSISSIEHHSSYETHSSSRPGSCQEL